VQLFNGVKQKAAEFAKDNATTLLTAGGVVGTIATAVLAGRGGIKAGQIILEMKGEIYADQFGKPEEQDNPYLKLDEIELPKKDMFLAVAPQFISPVITGTATIAAIIMSNRMSAQKAAALAAAYGLAERNFGEYKAKIEEKLTGPKKTAIDDELAHEAIAKTPGSEKIVFVEGEVLCLDRPTGRYFNSTMETIKQAVNATNAEVFNHGFARASFFYTELGLKDTLWTDEVGFNTENILELTYTTDLAPGNRPCIVIDFARLPVADYHPKNY
jgi:hypothetical protein